jgi:cytoskeleton protein RodZ
MAKVRSRKRQPEASGEAASTPSVSIGEQLRLARESRGLEISTVAEQLHLKRSTVLALEGEDFSRLPARVFVRGYYRNYARLMELPEEQLLRAFDARCPEGEECSTAPPVVARGVKKEIHSNHGLVKLVTWLVVISLFATFVLWWKDYTQRQATEAATEEPEPASAQVVAMPAAREPATSAAMPEQAVPAETQGDVVGKASAETKEPGVAETPGASERGESVAASPVLAVAEPKPSAPPGKIELRFNQDSWVDIRGAHRSFKLVGTRKAGEVLQLEGEPPYNIIIGNARGVTLLVDGKPYDFSSKTRRNVARLTLTP